MKFAVQGGLRRCVKKESLLPDHKDHEDGSCKPSRKSLVCTDEQGFISQKSRLYFFSYEQIILTLFTL
jgi:hypothetical protein